MSGTASDAHFDRYDLDYALASTPGTFVAFGTSTSPITAGALGTLPADDPLALSYENGVMTLRLTVLDDTFNQSVALRPIDLDRIEVTNTTSSKGDPKG